LKFQFRERHIRHRMPKASPNPSEGGELCAMQKIKEKNFEIIL
jgi:hypothetical protein